MVSFELNEILNISTGFMGGLTLVFVARWIGRRIGQVLSLTIRFSPRGGCQDAIVQELQKARKEILVQAYSFTADPLTYALVDAKKRGVEVAIVLDKSHEVDKYSDLKIFLEQGMNPLIDAEHAIAHNKIVIIDKKVVITGSYNFTNQAEGENAENVVIIKGHPQIAKMYRDNFLAHKAHSKPAELKAPVPARKAA